MSYNLEYAIKLLVAFYHTVNPAFCNNLEMPEVYNLWKSTYNVPIFLNVITGSKKSKFMTELKTQIGYLLSVNPETFEKDVIQAYHVVMFLQSSVNTVNSIFNSEDVYFVNLYNNLKSLARFLAAAPCMHERIKIWGENILKDVNIETIVPDNTFNILHFIQKGEIQEHENEPKSKLLNLEDICSRLGQPQKIHQRYVSPTTGISAFSKVTI